MNENEVKEEILSKLKINLEDSLFYMPGETIKGTIELNPSFKMKIKNNILHFKLKIFQCEFWEYLNTEIHELKNIYKTVVQTKELEYNIGENNSEYKDNSKIGEFSFIIFEKEVKNKLISIPFEFKIEEDNDKLLPTFQYEYDKYILGIRHVLIVECIEYGSMNYIGLFIGKSKRKDLDKEMKTTEYFPVLVGGLGYLTVDIILPKKTFYYEENVNFQIHINSNTLLFQTVSTTEQILNRKIEWVGYMANTVLNRTELNRSISNINQSNNGVITLLTLPFLPIKNAVGGALLAFLFPVFALTEADWERGNDPSYTLPFLASFLLAPITVPIATISGVGYGIFKQITNIMELFLGKKNSAKNMDVSQKIKNNSKMEKDIKIVQEELKKFIYFEENKVVGFARFKGDITPPVKGYYFNCSFNYKMNINLSGVILDNSKYFKTEIDYYDGEEYIKKMKNLLKVD